MSTVKNECDTPMQLMEQPDFSSNDEGSCGKLPTSSNGVVLKKGPWTSAEDAILIDYVKKHGEGNWNAVQKHSGLSRCGKSCRLRWANHLRPHLKKGSFTQEEEQMIIQMHSKIGNKWARMASLLPGRTDNEIKNYWNTRIKRRQRAGLPLYPPTLSIPISNEKQLTQNTSEFSCGGKQSTGVPQVAVQEMPELGFDPYRTNLEPSGPLPYASFMDNLPNGPGLSHAKIRESETSFPRYIGGLDTVIPVFDQLPRAQPDSIYRNLGGLTPLSNPAPDCRNLTPYDCSVPGSHAPLANGNFSASSNPSGSAKLELPSLQYPPEHDYSNLLTYSSTPYEAAVDSYIQSPEQSNSASPIRSGLLEALVHESQAISNGKKQPSDKCPGSAAVTPSDVIESLAVVNFCDTEREDANDPNPLLRGSMVSLWNEGAPMGGSSINVLPLCSTASEPMVWTIEPVAPEVMHDEVGMHRPDFLRPDALLGLDCLAAGSQTAQESYGMTDALATLLGESSCGKLGRPSSGSSTMIPLDSYSWKNMPRVFQLPDTV
ncbi:hypothetical protein HPP92_017600 [Vanilla planifolia]|uniref:Transcription factor GAMYB n=1 Tax=Vanilla planifolia TaxID=51239 RepID=A0A835QFS1_VANPL|nr:hypothetical protein HPP92_018213 [Vanilla planifolia]KAG0468272.1 hypothetical protein HPP92_017600 [Vanilla planifolia]